MTLCSSFLRSQSTVQPVGQPLHPSPGSLISPVPGETRAAGGDEEGHRADLPLQAVVTGDREEREPTNMDTFAQTVVKNFYCLSLIKKHRLLLWRAILWASGACGHPGGEAPDRKNQKVR